MLTYLRNSSRFVLYLGFCPRSGSLTRILYRWEFAGWMVGKQKTCQTLWQHQGVGGSRSEWRASSQAVAKLGLCVAGLPRTKRRTCWSLRNAARSQLAVRHPRHSGRLNPEAVSFRASSVATAVTHGGAMLWNLSREVATRWSGGFWAVAYGVRELTECPFVCRGDSAGYFPGG